MKILGDEISIVHQAYLRKVKVSQLSHVIQNVNKSNWEFKVHLLPPDTPITILQQLADSQNESDRQEVAFYVQTPVNILHQLGTDESKEVRKNVARNPNTPVTLLEELANDQEESVRSAVASNPHAPITILKKLITDEDNYCRDKVIKNLTQQILYNPNTPETFLEQLAEINNREITITVARHPNTSVKLLEELAHNSDWKIRQSVAQNPCTPIAIREKLAEDENNYVRNTALLNLNQNEEQSSSNLSDSLTIVNHQIGDNVLRLIKKYARNPQPTLSRLVTFFYPQIPEENLVKNFRSRIWLERYAIAKNPNTPRDIVQKMTEDGNRIVRDAANGTLARI